MTATNVARLSVSGATVTGYTVRKVQAAPRTSLVLSVVPRAITRAPVCLDRSPPSTRAIEQDGKGRR